MGMDCAEEWVTSSLFERLEQHMPAELAHIVMRYMGLAPRCENVTSWSDQFFTWNQCLRCDDFWTVRTGH